MKTKSLTLLVTAGALALGLRASAAPVYFSNLLADPGFESGMPVADAASGWTTVLGAAFSRNYHHSGVWSMACFYKPSFQLGLSYQWVPADPGVTYTFTAWGLVPDPLLMGPSAGTLIMTFSDANGSSLATRALPFMNGTTPANTWIPASLMATAPPGTKSVLVVVGLYGSVPGSVVYYDDLSLVAIPEPSSLALLVLVLGAGTRFGVRWRR